ncbi:hypothetical protein DAEQUDRAFT_669130 [Daedalea quercina L-15889]|uniref:F-box domain-containing protein n=1 Tax=Daedalea quercina L-15889 TaxID=1314783 RepID=A0A165QN32_9APHY|nr:hypothetical protein DAEQUDRAFT_669130 [Daedalea quercina L-15889]
MFPLEDLPIELLLNIIAYLPLQSLQRFRRVSKFVNHVITDNEALVYRQAATLHGYVECINGTHPPREEFNNPAYPFTNTASWKEYFDLTGQLCLELDRNWVGQGSATPRTYCTKNADVHRIKVDEEHGLLFTSHETGGIIVTDLLSGDILWTLPQNYVRTHAHLEYDNGFLIFDRFDSDKEVWRLDTDFEPAQAPPHARPDSPQRIASLFAEARYPTTRGHLKPWCLITTSQPTFAYRFAYPTLVVMSMDTAYLWDIPSATLVQTIRDVEEPFTHDDGDGDERATISYVDVSARHLFICGWHELRVFNRADGSLALRIPSQPTFTNARILLSHERRDAQTVPSTLPLPSFVAGASPPPRPSWARPHVSRCGRHLVAMLADNRLLLVENFERVVRGQATIADAALELNITVPENDMFIGIYLAYEFGRVSTSFRHLAGAYLPRLRNKHVLINLSCLQMSAARLYLTWDRRRADILERVPEPDGHSGGAGPGPVVAGRGGEGAGAGWRFDIEADNMDMYDEMLEDEMTLPPGPVMELHAGESHLCVSGRRGCG